LAAVRTRTTNHTSSTAHLSPALPSSPLSPHHHHRHPPYISPLLKRLCIPRRVHRRIYPLLHRPHHHAAFMAVCVHSARFVRKMKEEWRNPPVLQHLSSCWRRGEVAWRAAMISNIPMVAQCRLLKFEFFFCPLHFVAVTIALSATTAPTCYLRF
jgi:hypothetical protein